MFQIIKPYIVSLIRLGLAALFGALVLRGFISQEMADSWTDSGAEYFGIIVITLIVPLVTALYARFKQYFTTKAAIQLPSNTTVAEAEKVGAEKLFNAILPK